MRRVALLLLVLWLALSAGPRGQAAPTIEWEHSGTNVTHFQLQIATNWVVDMGLPTPTGDVYTYTLPALPAGSYNMIVRACYGTTCVDSATLTVSKGVVAGAASNNFYWVSPTGTASWANCKSDAPPAAGNNAAHCSRSTANSYAAAGDTVWFRGGTYSLGSFAVGIDPTNSGTQGNPIVFRAAPGETPVFTTTGFPTTTSYAFSFSGDSYIVLDGLTFQNIRSWGQFRNRSHHNEIRYCTFYNDYSQRQEGYATFGMDFNPVLSCGDGSKACYNTHNWLHHNTFEGVWADTVCGENVDIVRVGGAYGLGSPDMEENYNSIENNTFAHSTHTNLDFMGRYGTIRGNVFRNDPFTSGCQNWLKTTSTTSLAIGTGSKSLTVDTGLSLSGTVVLIDSSLPSSRAMRGTVTSYNSGTGELVVNITSTRGTGTYSDWKISQGQPPFYEDTALNGKYAHRNVQLSDDWAREGNYILVEGNRIGWGSNNPANGGPTNLDAASRRNLIRYNAIYGGMALGLYFKYGNSDYDDGPLTSTSSNTIGTGTKTFTVQTGWNIPAGTQFRIAATTDKRNAMYCTVTSYNSGTGELVVSVPSESDIAGSGTHTSWVIWGNGASGAGDQRVYNNTFFRNGTGYDWGLYATNNQAYSNRAIGQYDLQSVGTTPKNVIKNNLFRDNTADICGLGLTTPCSASAMDTVENNWLQASGDPLFVDPTYTNYASLTLPNLNLQGGSGAINGGAELTLANGAGASSVSLVVDDARYFQDGSWGSDLARSAGVLKGDWIAVGSTGNIARVASVDYDTNTLTLATPLTWSDNASVWLVRDSWGVTRLVGASPDYGAYEYGLGVPGAPSAVVVR